MAHRRLLCSAASIIASIELSKICANMYKNNAVTSDNISHRHSLGTAKILVTLVQMISVGFSTLHKSSNVYVQFAVHNTCAEGVRGNQYKIYVNSSIYHQWATPLIDCIVKYSW